MNNILSFICLRIAKSFTLAVFSVVTSICLDFTPIYCKITVNGESKRFSTGISISPKQWDTPKQKVKGKNFITEDINTTQQDITEQIQTIEKKLLEQQPEGFTIEDLYFCYKQ